MSWFTKPGSIFDMGPRFPVLDTNRQSSIPGLYLAGDVTGTPDVKAAINAGAEVARHLLGQEIVCLSSCDAHVIIIGGGPAGVSAALEFKKNGAEPSPWMEGFDLRKSPPLWAILRREALGSRARPGRLRRGSAPSYSVGRDGEGSLYYNSR